MLISNWLNSGWKSRILAGKGKTAIPYLHIIDLINLFLHLLCDRGKLSQCDTILASSDVPLSHNKLFELSTRYNFGQSITPIFMPKLLSYFGIQIMSMLGKLTGKPTFERPWMAKYIDEQMNVNISKTQSIIDWKPIPRYELKRRLLYLIENMKNNPSKWKKINKTILSRENRERPNVKIFEALIELKERTIINNCDYVMTKKNAKNFGRYQVLQKDELISRIRYLYHLFEIAIHYGDRQHILTFVPNLARARYLEGFEFSEICKLVDYLGKHIIKNLKSNPNLKGIKQRIESEITITVQIIKDEIEDVFDRLKANHPCRECKEAGIWLCTHDAALTVVNGMSKN